MSNMPFVLRCGAGKAAHVNNVWYLHGFPKKLMFFNDKTINALDTRALKQTKEGGQEKAPLLPFSTPCVG